MSEVAEKKEEVKEIKTVQFGGLALPVEAAEPTFDWKDQKTGMIGPAGIGKSGFWAEDAGAFFIQTEQGLGHLKVKKLAARSWGEFRQIVGALIEAYRAGKFPYETVIVDTIDRLISLADEECILRAKEKFKKSADQISSIGDIPEGIGWFWRQSMIEKAFEKLEGLPAHIVYIGHVTQREIKEATRKYDKSTINIGGKLGQFLTAWPDQLLNIDSAMVGDEIVRTVRTIPTQNVEAKCKSGRIPDGWKWTSDMAENFKKFRGAFN